MFAQALKALPLFKDLKMDQLKLLQPLIDPIAAQKDQLIFDQGEVAKYIYIVVKGEVLVRYKAYDGPVIPVSRVGPGGVFGWSAALGRSAYTSGAVCAKDSLIYRIDGGALRKICEQDSEAGTAILDRLASVIAERPKNTHGHIMTILASGTDCPEEYQTRMDKNGG
jgi:CRP-like cAMP-binding protein